MCFLKFAVKKSRPGPRRVLLRRTVLPGTEAGAVARSVTGGPLQGAKKCLDRRSSTYEDTLRHITDKP